MVVAVDALPQLALPAFSVRNTFLHFADDDEDASPEHHAAPRQGGIRARTLPASLLSAALCKATADISPCSTGSEARDAPAAEDCGGETPTAQEAAPEEATSAPEAAAREPESPPPGPEPLPTLLQGGGAADRAPAWPLKVSVRNTFLHFADNEDGTDESLPRRARRAQTGHAGAYKVLFGGEDAEDVAHQAESAPRPDAAAESARAADAEEPESPAVATKEAGTQMEAPSMQTLWVSLPAVPCLPVFEASTQQSRPDQSEDSPPKRQGKRAPATAGVDAARGGRGRRGPTERQRTTVVLQNLPLNYRRQMIIRMLDCEGFSGKYDFVYVPMDFKTRAGFGYAFVNLSSPAVVPSFWSVFEGFHQWMFPCRKVCRVSWSTPLQGLQAHVNRYRNSPLMHESVPDEYKPVLFLNGVRCEFPPPTRRLMPPSQPAVIKCGRSEQRRAS